jgi:hypothetical protein
MIELAFVSGRFGWAIYALSGVQHVLAPDGNSRPARADEFGAFALERGEFEEVREVQLDALKDLLGKRIEEQNALFLFIAPE